MTVKECYAMMDGDYEGVFSRLRKEERIVKFLGMFLRDPSYESLKDSVAANDRDTAFRAAHTLKGTAQNLSITKLHESSDALTEYLRSRTDCAGSEELLAKVTAAYEQAVAAIRALTSA